MSSNNAPFATLHDLPKYEKRANVVSAPWMQELPYFQSCRGHDPEPYRTCNSQTAPFATFDNVPRTFEYVGPMPNAPWDREQQPSIACRGSQPMSDYTKTTPYGTSNNFQRLQQNNAIVADAPWDKKLPSIHPHRGGGLEHSKLPSSQSAPFGTSENIEEQKQYDGPMPDAPWNKDQRPSIQQKVSSGEYFKNTPYATSENMECLKQSLEQVGEAPWNKEQSPPPSSRGGNHHEHVSYPSSHTAPYATFDNCLTLKPNRAQVNQAPWDRDEVHYNKVPQRFPHGEDALHYTSAHAPFATDAQ